MTIQEFNKKYNSYLKEGFQGLVIGNQEVIDYLDKEFEILTKNPLFSYSSIGLEYGYARVYMNHTVGNKLLEIEDNINKIIRT
jgi:hypothetical protein